MIRSCVPAGHMFFNKWAILLDPKDPSGGSRGYVKCHIYLVLRGEGVQVSLLTCIACYLSALSESSPG